MKEGPVHMAAACRFAVCVLLFASCGASDDQQVDASFIHIPGADGQKEMPEASWLNDSLDLGILAAGAVTQVEYVLENTGSAPLLIAQVRPSCGCTLARQWDESPIPAGESRTLILEFDAGERVGAVAEYATVVTNAVPSSSTLHFSARIVGPGSTLTP